VLVVWLAVALTSFDLKRLASSFDWNMIVVAAAVVVVAVVEIELETIDLVAGKLVSDTSNNRVASFL